MSLYFDDTATRKPDPEILAVYMDALKTYTGNPATGYAAGRAARQAIDRAAAEIAEALACDPEEVIFTSSASESINTALKSIAWQSRRRAGDFLAYAGEHAASQECLNFLAEASGRHLTYLPLAEGKMEPDRLADYLRSHAVDLITVMYVSNLTGIVNPIAELVELRDQYAPQARFHLDAVQALGKVPIRFSQLGVDFLSLSLHKVGCPKGSGLLLARKNVPLTPLIHGGGQQHGRRSSTENPALAVASALAVEKAVKQQAQAQEHCARLKDILLTALREKEVHFQLCSPEPAVPQIVALYLPDLRAENLQTALSAEGIEIGIGSACSSGKKRPAAAILALGLSDEAARHMVRISLSPETEPAEVCHLVERMAELLRLYGVSS